MVASHQVPLKLTWTFSFALYPTDFDRRLVFRGRRKGTRGLDMNTKHDQESLQESDEFLSSQMGLKYSGVYLSQAVWNHAKKSRKSSSGQL